MNDFAGRLQIKLLRQPNGGCASARQLGSSHAKRTRLAFTDDDCRPEPDWLTRIEAAVKRDPKCAVAGRTVNGSKDDLYAEATQSIVKPLVLPDAMRLGSFIMPPPKQSLVFPTAPLFAIGAMDPTPWRIAGGEDRGLCAARWTRAGHRLLYEPSASVLHYHRLNLDGFLRQHFHYGRSGRGATTPTRILRPVWNRFACTPVFCSRPFGIIQCDVRWRYAD